MFATSLERSVLGSKVITDWPETGFLELYSCWRFAKRRGLPIFLQPSIETFSRPAGLRLSVSNHLWLWGLDPPPCPSQDELLWTHGGLAPRTTACGSRPHRGPINRQRLRRRHESALRWKERWNPNQALKALLEPFASHFLKLNLDV